MDWEDDDIQEELEWEGEEWAWEEDMPTPLYQTWHWSLTAEG